MPARLMKPFVTVAALLLSMVSLVTSDTFSEKTVSEIETDLKSRERELDSLISLIRTRYSADKRFCAKLEEAQRAWCRYRDLQIEMKFPEADKKYAYGSLYPMCLTLELIRLYTRRIEELMPWASGIADGEVCPGSVLIERQ